MKKILIMTADKVGHNMAGPAIRAIEMAKYFSSYFKVILGARTDGNYQENGFSIIDISSVHPVIPEMDIIIGHGLFFHKFKFKKRKEQLLIIDLYNLFLTENVICYRSDFPDENFLSYQLDLYKLNYQLLLGDHFLCSNDAQYNFIAGMLVALNKVNITNMDNMPITIIPFGLHETPKTFSKGILKGGYKGINKDDKVIIWGGGIWDWLDPFTAIKALNEVVKHRKDVKLFFMGIESPNPDVIINNSAPLKKLAETLDLKDKFVFFNSWVPYKERHHYLMDADIGLTLHLDSQETRFSSRTRMMDYLWCGLPVISTKGDSMADLIERKELGKTINYQDEKKLSELILQMLGDDNMMNLYKENIKKCREDFRWNSVLSPLKTLCDTTSTPPDYKQNGKISFRVDKTIHLNKLQLLRELLRVRGVEYVWNKLIRHRMK